MTSKFKFNGEIEIEITGCDVEFDGKVMRVMPSFTLLPLQPQPYPLYPLNPTPIIAPKITWGGTDLPSAQAT